MRITWEHIALQLPNDTMRALLDDWRWLVDEAYSPLFVTSMGDMVLVSPSRHVFLLDAGGCKLREIAESMAHFQQAISIKENAQEWFLTNVLGDLLESGATLEPDQCFGYKVQPILSGTIEPDNFEPTHVAIHFGVCGQIGEKTRELAAGTVINKITLDGGSGSTGSGEE